jgi:hypothetical protein
MQNFYSKFHTKKNIQHKFNPSRNNTKFFYKQIQLFPLNSKSNCSLFSNQTKRPNPSILAHSNRRRNTRLATTIRRKGGHYLERWAPTFMAARIGHAFLEMAAHSGGKEARIVGGFWRIKEIFWGRGKFLQERKFLQWKGMYSWLSL